MNRPEPKPSLGEICDRLGLRPKSLKFLGGLHNSHWLLSTDQGLVVLRRYWARRSMNYVQWELRLLEHLARAGWPVPTPVTEPIEAAGHVWSACVHLPGRSPSPRSPAGIRSEQRSRGRLLAKLHMDMSKLTHLPQREGWVRSEEVFGVRDNGPPLDEVIESLALTRPAEAGILRWHAERARDRLEQLEAHKLPAMVIHGDFASWNLRYRRGKLSAVLDFELAHLNHRVADFALSWRGHHDEVVHGYQEVEPPAPAELELMTPVWWAWCLEGARDQLLRESDSNLDWVLTHITRRSLLTVE